MDIALISFVITIVAFGLQVADAFPEHREVRKTMVVLSSGVFLGILISGFLGARYEITGNVDARYALLFALVGLAGAFALIAVVVSEETRRQVALLTAGCFAVGFILTGIGYGMNSAPANREPNLSETDLMVLARASEGRGAFDDAVDWLEQLNQREGSQNMQEQVRAKIDALRKRQAEQVSR